MVKTEDINTDIIIDIFDKNLFKALEYTRKFGTITVRLKPKTIEREIILRLISIGWRDKEIAAAVDVNIFRVRRLRLELADKKREVRR